jgi:hypothetical protein
MFPPMTKIFQLLKLNYLVLSQKGQNFLLHSLTEFAWLS